MKTRFCFLVLASTVAGLQAGPDANIIEENAAYRAKQNAILTAPVPGPDPTQAKILAELQKQTALLQAQRPIVVYDPKAPQAVPVTVVPVR